MNKQNQSTDGNGKPAPFTFRIIIVLLALNLLVAIASLAHVVYYIPENRFGDGNQQESTLNETDAQKMLATDGIGSISIGNRGQVVFELIDLTDLADSAQPKLLQKVTMSPQQFLDSYQRMSVFRDRLEEAKLIRRQTEQ